jgi:hypothetical protein
MPGVKGIGKPCMGKPYGRFDEGEQANMATYRLVRHRQTKGTATDRPGLRRWEPLDLTPVTCACDCVMQL